MGEEVRAMRGEADIPHYWPRWWVLLAQRMGRLQPGRVYTITVAVPEGGGDPQWFVTTGAPLEGGK